MDKYPIIGMSPGNSYFKDAVIKELLQKVIEKYGKAAVFVADIPAIATYVALGYPPNIARREKAVPQGNSLKNRTRRAMSILGYTDSQIKIVDWSTEVENNAEYQKEYKKVVNLYEENRDFRNAASEATKSVLEYSSKKPTDIDKAIEIAVHYLLSEFAFLEFAPKHFNVDKVTYIYHKTWPVYEAYISGKFDGKQRNYLTSDILTPNKKSEA